MIKRLKRKFIIMSTVSLLVLLSLIVTVMNLINYRSVVAEADTVLLLLSQNKGTFPGAFEPEFEGKPNKNFGGNNKKPLPHNMSPELPYESRFFSVLLKNDGTVVSTDTSRITVIDDKTATEYATDALSKENKSGSIGQYRYLKSIEGELVRITFLDCGRKIDAVKNFLITSCVISLCGFVLVSLVICFVSGRIIRPIAESYEKQKRFITDAGHEIKTPLTIINANADVLEMEYGGIESVNDIKQQTKRLTILTNQLISLARMEESENNIKTEEVSFSDITREICDSFKALAEIQNKRLLCETEASVNIRADGVKLGQLVSILIDNAIKYSADEGEISVELVKQNRSAILTVTNKTKENISKEQLEHVFERFYRTDDSRNSATGGHGIGLSLAKAIVNLHGGKIYAASNNENVFKITAVLPE